MAVVVGEPPWRDLGSLHEHVLVVWQAYGLTKGQCCQTKGNEVMRHHVCMSHHPPHQTRQNTSCSFIQKNMSVLFGCRSKNTTATLNRFFSFMFGCHTGLKWNCDLLRATDRWLADGLQIMMEVSKTNSTS